MNTEVTNVLRKNISISTRYYTNVLLQFNHELTHSKHPTTNV